MIANSGVRLSVDALTFDAYGTLFDVQSVAAAAERLFPQRGGEISQLWRSKQLEYSWLQSLMQSPHQRREDFAALTAHALDYAADALGLALTGGARHRLLVLRSRSGPGRRHESFFPMAPARCSSP